MLINRISNTECPPYTDVRFLRSHLIKAHFLTVTQGGRGVIERAITKGETETGKSP